MHLRGCLENLASTDAVHSEAEVERWRTMDVVLTLRAQDHLPQTLSPAPDGAPYRIASQPLLSGVNVEKR